MRLPRVQLVAIDERTVQSADFFGDHVTVAARGDPRVTARDAAFQIDLGQVDIGRNSVTGS